MLFHQGFRNSATRVSKTLCDYHLIAAFVVMAGSMSVSATNKSTTGGRAPYASVRGFQTLGNRALTPGRFGAPPEECSSAEKERRRVELRADWQVELRR